jgi:hypothetical protein
MGLVSGRVILIGPHSPSAGVLLSGLLLSVLLLCLYPRFPLTVLLALLWLFVPAWWLLYVALSGCVASVSLCGRSSWLTLGLVLCLGLRILVCGSVGTVVILWPSHVIVLGMDGRWVASGWLSPVRGCTGLRV